MRIHAARAVARARCDALKTGHKTEINKRRVYAECIDDVLTEEDKDTDHDPGSGINKQLA